MRNQLQFQLKRYRGGRLVAVGIPVIINLLLLLFFAPQPSSDSGIYAAISLIPVALCALMVPIFILPPLIDLFREFFALYSKNRGILVYMTPAKGFDIVFSRVFVLGAAFILSLLLAILPLLFYSSRSLGALDSTVFTFVNFAPDIYAMAMQFLVQCSSIFAGIALIFCAGAFFRTVFAAMSGRVILAILVFITGQYLLAFIDILAFLPESWRIGQSFPGLIRIDADIYSPVTTTLYILLQFAKMFGLCWLSGRLLDKRIDISA